MDDVGFKLQVFQFTPLREGRPGNSHPLKLRFISIHAPPRGATPCVPREHERGEHFNSRPSARGDVIGTRTYGNILAISIHAPPRGATVTLFSVTRNCIDFNSRPSARGDASRNTFASYHMLFQFTPLREGRRRKLCHRERANYFNSRPSARGDINAGNIRHPQKDFNSRPSARGDLFERHVHKVQNHFNSRPSARGDSRTGISCLKATISIHAPPRGATTVVGEYIDRALFQFTPHREGRRTTCERLIPPN